MNNLKKISPGKLRILVQHAGRDYRVPGRGCPVSSHTQVVRKLVLMYLESNSQP